MILVDSNILVYAINRSSPKHRRSQEFLRLYIDHLCVAQQNILESLRVLTHPVFPHPMHPADAMTSLKHISDACIFLTPTREAYEIFTALLKKYLIRSDGIYDAYLVATALSCGVEAIATDNTKDFQRFSEISIIHPFEKV